MSMSYQSYIKQVEARLHSMTAGELRQLILGWAEGQKPEGRYRFLERLQQVNTEDRPEMDDEALLEAVQAFCARVSDGDYITDDDWAYEDDEDDFERGDTSWASEMDGFLAQARLRMMDKQYAIASRVYELLFTALAEGQEPGHLPGDPDPENMLQEYLAEHIALYFYAVYLTTDQADRPQRLYQTISCPSFLLTRFNLTTINQAMREPLPDLNAFLPQWTDYLLEHPFAHASRLIRDALQLQDDVTLAEFSRAHAERFPGAYVDWLDRLLAKNAFTEVVAVSREALMAIDADRCIRAQIGDRMALIGDKRGDTDLLLEGCSAAFYSEPTLPRLLRLYQTGWQTGTCDKVWQQAVARLQALLEQPYRPGHDQQDPDLRLVWGNKLLLAHAQLLRGGYDEAMEMAQSSGSLGWTYGENPKPVIYFFFVAALTPADRRYPWITEQWQSVIQKTAYQGETSLFLQYQNLADQCFAKNPADKAQQDALLHWLLQEATGRISAIVNNKYRSSYHKAATLLAVLAQTLSSLGRQQDGRDLVSQIEASYSRYSAFRAEIRQACRQIKWH